MTNSQLIDEKPTVVRFAGDSGDGIQLLGTEFAKSSALMGAGFMTLPDYPAEIRAPTGTTFGVSAYQVRFGPGEVLTPGDLADVLVAFNPAALKTNLDNLRKGGTLIVDEATFNKRGLVKAGFEVNPLEDGFTEGYQLIAVDITKRTLEALEPYDLSRKEALRARNFWALGLIFWLFQRDPGPTERWIAKRFEKDRQLSGANTSALKAGHAYGEIAELNAFLSDVPAPQEGGEQQARMVSGTQAMAYGIAAIAALSELDVIYCSYPITPASALLHALAALPGGVQTFQAEDEIAAVCAAIGASYGGALGISASSGPGLALKTEAMGLAVAAELPLIVIDVQRAGPSTGMPTKPEQSDLHMAVLGRHGEAPCPVLAPATPADSMHIMIEAAKMAIESMTPVIVLSDAYLANAASDWEPPDVHRLPDLKSFQNNRSTSSDGVYARDEQTLARSWIRPGTPDDVFRIGGLEKDMATGNISYDPRNHEDMVRLRAEKISRIADRRPPVSLESGSENGRLLVIGWGSTYGAIKRSVTDLEKEGHEISHLHLRQLWPFPRGLKELMQGFSKVICVEMNSGQLSVLLRSQFLIDVEPVTQITGQPFHVTTLKAEFLERLGT